MARAGGGGRGTDRSRDRRRHVDDEGDPGAGPATALGDHLNAIVNLNDELNRIAPVEP